MFLPRFTSLNWAFQLHYYLCFRTHRRQTLVASRLDEIIREICNRHNYHLLEWRAYSDHVRSVVSLKPADSIATVMQIKSHSN